MLAGTGTLAGCGLVPGTSPIPTIEPSPTPTVFAEDVARAYLKAWGNGDYNAMYTMLAPSSLATISVSDFVKRYQAITLEVTIAAVKTNLVSVHEEGNEAQVKFSVTFDTILVGSFTQENSMQLRRDPAANRWGVLWSSTLIFAELQSGYTVHLTPYASARGGILDVKGRAFTTEQQLIQLDVIPVQMKNENQVLGILARVLGKTSSEIKANYSRYPGDWRTTVGTISTDVFKSNLKDLNQPGILTDTTKELRTYPYGQAAAHVIGYIGQLSGEELDKMRLKGYHEGDVVGKTGLEAWGEPILGGTRGGKLMILTPGNTIVTTLAIVPAKQSQNIYSTLDMDIQQIADKAMGDKVGAAVVMDVSNGNVLALLSNPGFDPNKLSQKITSQELNALLNDPNIPLVNRVTQSAFPPGSVFKIISFSAALERGGMVTGTPFYDPGYWDGLGQSYRKVCWIYTDYGRGHGTLSLTAALTQSCDVAFYQVGQRLDKIDRNILPAYARAFGLGSPTGIEISDTDGNIPDPNVGTWRPGDPINMVIGQGNVLASPLQIATMVAAIANGGTLYEPHLVARISSIADRTEQITQPKVRGKLPLTPANLTSLRDALRRVTQSQEGTAYLAFRGCKIAVAGKTGTAEVQKDGKPHSWFASYAPADDPKIAVVVIAEHGGEGSSTAAPIVRKIVEDYFARPNK